MININKNFPSLIKYMGSKTEIIKFIEYGINMIHRNNQPICDLFAGSATLSGALRGKCDIISNDIQSYSEILAKTYLNTYSWDEYPTIEQLCDIAQERVERFNNEFHQFNNFNYNVEFDLDEFNRLEKEQQQLINFEGLENFDDYYLYTKYYSGTYWSYNQCVWIDSIKYVADQYKHIEPLYDSIISSLMYAMAYNSQSTGHYAQYRDATTIRSMDDILIYRRKSIREFFVRKFTELTETFNDTNNREFTTSSLDYMDCLNNLEEGTLVYADPPYCFVHYSRFYHAIETLIRYDYPDVAHKGRYREDRYQSPFCIKTQVNKAFQSMFNIIKDKKLDLVLSYSNSETNTIALIDLLTSACVTLNNITNEDQIENIRVNIENLIDQPILRDYIITEQEQYQVINITNDDFFKGNIDRKYTLRLAMVNYNHSTMGRREDRLKQVKEILIVAKLRR
ncbi:hypothetical protein FDF01_11900 [Clostridium botulinum]|nr:MULTISPECIES: DNA adenine methylase [unclassified Clostridium]MBY6852995.1 DNA adenine methylase [Clostridium botulinum]NFH71741.1 hypothetical protein [Clostridium botulinum]NFI00719.1 hypothetical protein [Clostridium botulinum]NFI62447.1 hypothetical protein [Clostridium botulinum]NFI80484.1 hypothetical protein [Clostridium botulinum]